MKKACPAEPAPEPRQGRIIHRARGKKNGLEDDFENFFQNNPRENPIELDGFRWFPLEVCEL